MAPRRLPLAIPLLAILGSTGAHAQDATSLGPHAAAWSRLLAAEDGRAATPAQLATLVDGARSPEAALRMVAVRGLGRLERADLADRIAPLLRDTDPAVRAAAAHALGQAFSRGDGAAGRAAVLPALDAERDPSVAAAMAETLGRLRHGDGDAARQTAGRLAALLAGQPDAVRLGAVRGLFFLARQQTGRGAVAAHATALHEVLRDAAGDDDVRRRTRRLAVATPVAAAAQPTEWLGRALADPDPLVRREAVVGLGAATDATAAQALLERALTDAAATVRYEALRVHARRFAQQSCPHLMAALRDADAHVRLLAIDQLRTGCAGEDAATQELVRRAQAMPAAGAAWHEAARSLGSLAARDAGAARSLLPQYAEHPVMFVRAHAAAAAGTLADTATLLRLAGDAHANVRTAAVQALRRTAGRAADSVYLVQLEQDDSQLIMAAVAALDSTSGPRTAPAMLDALDRISRQRRETSRDARVPLLAGARRHGSAALRARVEPYLTDFDPRIADLAADILGEWTGTRPQPRPSAPPALPLPSFALLDTLAGSTFVLEMDDGGVVEIRLLPFTAPTNAARFARLARSGYFDGLTFHRIATNFVVQGGSPGANEYAGEGPFTRDELGGANWRGTVGLSTRGRDTGDAQIFINTIDNVRLDHDYTVFGEVVRGMDVVDRMQEGTRIRRVTERR